jgi:Zn-dependent peptidase ImmA (M78 family)
MKKTLRDLPQRRANLVLEQFDMVIAPVPVDRLARLLGAIVKFSPLDKELSGMIFIRNDHPIIGVNSLHHSNRQRFTIAHELGHLLLHREHLENKVHVDKQFRVLLRDKNASAGVDRMEVEANQFAAELLIPSALLHNAIQEEFDIDDESFFEDLAKRFKVSKQMLEYRIRNLP